MNQVANFANRTMQNPMVRYNPMINPVAAPTIAHDILKNPKGFIEGGKDVAKGLIANPVRLGKIINYTVTQKQMSDMLDRGEIDYNTYNKMVSDSANEAGIGINDDSWTVGRKVGGAVGGTALDVLTAGTMSPKYAAGLKTFKLGKTANYAAPLLNKMAAGSTIGGLMGAANTLQRDELTKEQAMYDIGGGAILGGVVPAGIHGIGKAWQKLFPKQAADAADSAIQARLANRPANLRAIEQNPNLDDAQRFALAQDPGQAGLKLPQAQRDAMLADFRAKIGTPKTGRPIANNVDPADLQGAALQSHLGKADLQAQQAADLAASQARAASPEVQQQALKIRHFQDPMKDLEIKRWDPNELKINRFEPPPPNIPVKRMPTPGINPETGMGRIDLTDGKPIKNTFDGDLKPNKVDQEVDAIREKTRKEIEKLYENTTNDPIYFYDKKHINDAVKFNTKQEITKLLKSKDPDDITFKSANEVYSDVSEEMSAAYEAQVREISGTRTDRMYKTIQNLNNLKSKYGGLYEFVRREQLAYELGYDSYKDVPDVIKVYRGQGGKYTPNGAPEIFSIDQDVAKRFAGKSGDTSVFQINKKDVPPVNNGYAFSGGGESEITLENPKAVLSALNPTKPIANTFDGPLPKKETSDITLFRSGDIDPKSKRGIFLSNERSNAENYQSTGTGGKTTHEYTLSKDAKMYEAENTTRLLKELRPDIDKNNIIDRYIRQQSQNGGKLIDGLTAEQRADIRVESIIKQELSKRGYDGVSYTGGKFDDAAGEYQLFNSKHLKRVSKLTESDVQRDLEYHFDMLPDKLGREYLPSDMSVIQKNLIDGKPPYDGLTGAAKMPPPKPIKNTFDGPLPKQDPLEALKAEARKYKSAEEFVKAQGEPLYHGTKSDFAQFDNAKMGSQTDSGMYGKGFYLTPNQKSAKHYAGEKGYIKEVYADMKNPYVINTQADIPDIKVPNKTLEDMRNGPENYSRAFTKYLKDKGYDGVIDNLGVADNQRVVFDANQLKTKQQLTDLYNQATKPIKNTFDGPLPKKDPLEALKAEARKYKSAEEFVKANYVAHGTPNKIEGNIRPSSGWYGKATYLTDDITGASGRGGGQNIYFVEKPKGKLLDIKAHGSKDNTTFTPKQYQDAIDNGYDGIRIKHDNGKTWYAMFKEQPAKTKQQLTDLYNQATKPERFNELVPKSYLEPPKAKPPITEQGTANIVVGPPKGIRNIDIIKEDAASAKANFYNRFDSIEKLVKKVELERGTKLKPSENPTYLVKQFLGGGGIANGKIDMELTPIIKQTKDFDGLRNYLVATRMNELAQRGLSKRGDDMLADLSKRVGPEEIAKFDKIAKELYAYQQRNLDELLEVGVLTPEQHANILAKNKSYIPFNRVIPDMEQVTTQAGQKIKVSQSPIKAIKGSDKDIIDPIESMIRNTYDIQAVVQKQKVLRSLTALAPDEFVPLKSTAPRNTPAIEMFVNGKRQKFETNKAISDALNSMNEERLNAVVKMMSIPAKMLRSGATSFNVAFALPNIVRDQLSAAVNSKYGGVPMYDFVSGLASVIKKDDSYKKWILSGADQASFFAQDRTTLSRSVQDITGGYKHKVGKLIKSPLELFRIAGEYSEKGSRVGVFKRAMKGAAKEGLTGEDLTLAAMRESREATIDFAQRGSKMKAYNALVPFLNARVQGTGKLMQSFKQRPVQTMAIGASIASVPAGVLYAYNTGDPERERIYNEIPEYIKREYFVMVIGDKETPFVKIPKGEVGKIFGNPVESFLASARADDPEWKSTAISIIDSFLPVGSVEDPQRFITDASPTAVAVPYQMMSNFDAFRKSPIISQFQKDLPPEQQYSKYNTETGKKIGDALNISPAMLEFGISGFTGGLGRQGLQMLDIAQGVEIPRNEMPVASRFLGKEKDLRDSANKVYEEADKARIAKARENFNLKKRFKEGDESVLEGLDAKKQNEIRRDAAEDQIKETLNPKEKALWSLSNKDLEAMAERDKDAQTVLDLKDSLKSETSKSSKKKSYTKIRVKGVPKVKKSRAKKGRKAKVVKPNAKIESSIRRIASNGSRVKTGRLSTTVRRPKFSAKALPKIKAPKNYA